MSNTYPTSDLPLGSTSPKVLYNNASNLDEAVNAQQPTWVDRFGVLRKTWDGMQEDFQNFLLASGYEWVGDYVDGTPGLQFTARNQYTVRSGIAYRPAQTTALPYTTTGVWATDQSKFVAFSTDTDLAQNLLNSTDPTKGGALVGYYGRNVTQALDDRISVKRFGAKGDGVTDDTAAFIAAINYLKTGTEEQGGTIHIPRGWYKINQTLQIDEFNAVTNFYFEGDGVVNTVLDFGGCPPGSDGFYFNGGSQVGVSNMLITSAPNHGITINKEASTFVSFAQIENVRIQFCGGWGIYSFQSYLVTLRTVFCTVNTGGGINFAGSHTSIIGDKIYTANNTGSGLRINGAIYIDINAQSDNNARGYLFTNIRGGLLRSLGSESNKAEGILLRSSNAEAAGLLPEFQNIQGLVIASGCHLRNNTAGPLGANSSIAVVAQDGRPINFTMIGVVDNVVSGDYSVAVDGSGGAVSYTEIDCQWDGPVAITPTVVRRNLTNTGKYALCTRASGAVSVPSSSLTTMVWDGFSAGENTMNATRSSTEIIIPAGVSKVHVSACITWSGVSGGNRYMAIQKNGAGLTGLPAVRVPSAGSATMPMTVASGKPIPVVAGDKFTVILIQDQGAPVNVEGLSGAGNWFSVEALC